jgi:hypothetical protein
MPDQEGTQTEEYTASLAQLKFKQAFLHFFINLLHNYHKYLVPLGESIGP